MLTYVLYSLFILACFVLVLSVLLQPGKADAGALFTSSVSSTAFGPRGTQTILAKITIVAAITFMLTALAISFGIGGTRSVLQTTDVEEAPAQQQPATPAASPQSDASPAPQQGDAGAGAATAPADNANAANANATNTNAAANTDAGNANNSNAANANASNANATTTASPQRQASPGQ